MISLICTHIIWYIQKPTLNLNELQLVRKLEDAIKWIHEMEVNVKGTSLPSDLAGLRKLQRKHADIQKQIDDYEQDEVRSNIMLNIEPTLCTFINRFPLHGSYEIA